MVVEQLEEQNSSQCLPFVSGLHCSTRPSMMPVRKGFFQNLVSQQTTKMTYQPYCLGPEGTNRLYLP